jgi:hypothetical protein
MFRENARLQRPYSAAFRRFHQGKQRRLANTCASRVGRYVNGYFGDACVNAAFGDRTQGRPAKGPLPVPCHQPAVSQVLMVPFLPGRSLGLEGSVSSRDTLPINPADVRPVFVLHRFKMEVHVLGRAPDGSTFLSRFPRERRTPVRPILRPRRKSDAQRSPPQRSRCPG